MAARWLSDLAAPDDVDRIGRADGDAPGGPAGSRATRTSAGSASAASAHLLRRVTLEAHGDAVLAPGSTLTVSGVAPLTGWPSTVTERPPAR